MEKLKISITCCAYDRTMPLIDGRVPINGCDAAFVRLPVRDMFLRALRDEEFDVAELPLGTYLTSWVQGERPYIALPIFTSRMFRHSAIYVRTDREIDAPSALVGRCIGVPDFRQTTGIWARGLLDDEYGVAAKDIRWVVGGVERAEPRVSRPVAPPEGLRISYAPDGATLSAMFASGELDGLIVPREPLPVINGAANVGRLFTNYPSVEEEYYKRTGLFPLMHAVGVRTRLVEQHPWLLESVYEAFSQARGIALEELDQLSHSVVMLPWVKAELERLRSIGSGEYWPYGVSANRGEIETLVRYAYKDGLIADRPTPEQLFPQWPLA